MLLRCRAARPLWGRASAVATWGLLDQQQDQVPSTIAIQKITRDPPALGSYLFTEGDGFDVVDAQITSGHWIGLLDSADVYRRLEISRSANTLSVALSSTPPMPLWDPSACPVFTWVDDAGQTRVSQCYTLVLTLANPPGTVYTALRAAPASGGLGALGSPAVTATPGPFPILAAAAAYRSSRQLKRRLRQARGLAWSPIRGSA